MYGYLKLRIPHYMRQGIVNLGNSGEVQGNSGDIRRKAIHSFSLVFPGVKYISLLGKSKSPDFSSGNRENSCGKKWKGIHWETGIPFPYHFISPPPPHKFQLHSTYSVCSVSAVSVASAVLIHFEHHVIVIFLRYDNFWTGNNFGSRET